MKNINKWILFLISVSVVLLALEMWPKKLKLVSDDGNFLFYNFPAVDSDGKQEFIAYLKKSGKVVVKSLNKSDTHSEILIHDYSGLIRKGKAADDHAAPSIIFNKDTKEFLIATAYHGTDLLIYTLKNNQVKLKKRIAGRYTYPRWLQLKGEILLFSRLQSPVASPNGHLVYRSSMDNFEAEKLAIKSEKGSVIYASVPKSSQDNNVYIQHSTHSYKENRLIGWSLIKLNPSNGKIVETCDLTDILPKKYFSNRPTGISIKGSEFLIGTAYMTKKNWILPEGNFNRVNDILLVKGSLNEMCNSAKVVHKGAAKTPYYHTSVAISDSFDWLYFDNDKYVSNSRFTGCFSRDGLMYPFFYKDELFYTSSNMPYSIRNFHNSILRCY